MTKKVYNVDEQVIEIELSDNQITEIIDKLKELKESKTHTHFSLDKQHELLIHHKGDKLK
ncbi:MAG: hypothetical protein WCK90_04180 [archaeon]